MSQLTVQVPNLISGISQQPDSLRFPSQAERQVNAYASVVDGLIKRHPTEHVAKLYDAGDEGTQFRVIPIRGTDGVDYFAHLTRSNMRVFDVSGNEYPVHSTDFSSPFLPDFSYLAPRDLTNALSRAPETLDTDTLDWAANGSDPHDPEILGATERGPYDFKRAILVGNDAAATDAARYGGPASWDTSGKVWLSFFVKAHDVDPADSFDIWIDDFSGSGLTWTASFSVSGGVITDDGTTTAGAESGVTAIETDGWYRAWIGVDPSDPSNPGIVNGGSLIYRLSVQTAAPFPDKFLRVWGGAFQYGGDTLPNYFVDQAPYRYVTIQDTTIIANTLFPSEMSGETTDTLADTTTSGTDQGHAFLFVRQGAFKTTYSVTINASTVTTSTWDGTTAVGSEISSVKTEDIAADLATKISALGLTVATSQGAVVRIERATAITTFRTSDSQGDTALVGINGRVTAFEDLPLTCVHGYKVLVEASPETIFDDYYVEFVAESGTFSDGHWVESTPFNTRFKLDAETMPHQLVRKVDDRNGTVTGTPHQVWFDWTQIDWEDRLAGDEDSNPDPIFVTVRDNTSSPEEYRFIKDVFFHQGRLGFLSGEYLLLSEANRFFAFFRTSVRDTIDSDPIEIATSAPRSSPFHTAVPFNNRLIVFSALNQVTLDTSGQALTPATASLTSVLEYENLAVHPFSTGRGIFFAYEQPGFSGVREMFPVGEGVFYDSEDSSAQVPRYIEGNILDLQGSALEDILVMRTDTTKTKLWVHKWFRSGNEKIQSAWFEYQFGADVEEMFFLDSTLHLILRRTEGVFHEKMTMGDGVVDSESDYITHLDRRISDETDGVTGTYDAVTDTTEFTLPYDIESGQDMVVVTRQTGAQEGGIILQIDSTDTSVSGSHTITVLGEHDSTPVWIGEMFTMEYQFSDAALRVPTRNGTVSTVEGRFQVRFGALNFADSSYFKVLVTPDHGSTYEYEMSGSVVGSGLTANELSLVTGRFRFPVAARNTEVTVTIENATPVPCRLLNAEWLGTFTSRFRR